MQQAIDKLRTEMSSKQDGYTQMVGNFLISQLEKEPGLAEKILVPERSISGSLQAMRDEAKKIQKGGMAMFTPEEGFGIVLKYFGSDSKPEEQAAVISQSVASAPKKQINIDIDSIF